MALGSFHAPCHYVAALISHKNSGESCCFTNNVQYMILHRSYSMFFVVDLGEVWYCSLHGDHLQESNNIPLSSSRFSSVMLADVHWEDCDTSFHSPLPLLIVNHSFSCVICHAGSDMTQAWPWRCRRDETLLPLCWSCCLGRCSSLFGTRAPSPLYLLLEKVTLLQTQQWCRCSEHLVCSFLSQQYFVKVYVPDLNVQTVGVPLNWFQSGCYMIYHHINCT